MQKLHGDESPVSFYSCAEAIVSTPGLLKGLSQMLSNSLALGSDSPAVLEVADLFEVMLLPPDPGEDEALLRRKTQLKDRILEALQGLDSERALLCGAKQNLAGCI